MINRISREKRVAQCLKETEEQLQGALVQLHNTFEQTIQVLTSAFETMDTVTVRHQIRVAGIAYAIAREIGLSEQMAKGVRVAGLIHDTGKICVPSEILFKPSKLGEAEKILIRQHPQKGFEILKGLEFPWPLAQIIMQHHERMDGSGYPQGLPGKDILLEARIVAVADVVEAMSSHRPYREALVLGRALEELKQNSGTLYDSEVVCACIKLFIERDYKLGEDPQMTNSNCPSFRSAEPE